jgi:hypothetical protein
MCYPFLQPLELHIIFELQMEYQTAIYFLQQVAAQHSNGFSDTPLVYGSDLVAKSARIFRQMSFLRG